MDGPFKDFYNLFTEYQSKLDELPAAWAKASKAAGGGAAGAKASAFSAKALSVNTKDAANNQQRFANASRASARSVSTLARDSAKVAKNIGSATLSLIRWAGISTLFGGLLGAGGLFGLSRLADSVSGSRRSALGMNTDQGSQRSFALNYGRFVDPSSFLGNVNEAMQDYSKRWTLYAAGLTEGQIKGKDTSEVAEMLLPKLRQRFIAGGRTAQSAEAFGLTQFASLQDLNRLANSSPEDLAAARAAAGRDRGTLAIADSTQKAWQDFSTQLSRAGESIETTFVKGLTPLVGPFTKLSDSISKALATALANPALPGYIDDLGKGIEKFAKYLSSDAAGKDVGEFFNALSKMAKGLEDVASFLGIFDLNKPIVAEADKNDNSFINKMSNKVNQFIGDMGFNPYTDKNSPEYRFYELEKANKLPVGMLDRVWNKETRRGAITSDSPKGAQGPFQFMPDTGRDWGLNSEADRKDFTKSSDAAARYLGRLMMQFGGDPDKAAAAYNWGPGNVRKTIEAYGADWYKHLPGETADYVKAVGSGRTPYQGSPGASGALGGAAGGLGGASLSQTIQGYGAAWTSRGGSAGYTAALGAAQAQTPGVNPNLIAASQRAQVVIQNNTGGSAVVLANQAAY